MRRIIAIAAVALAGCAHQVVPKIEGQTLRVTPIDGASAQVIAPDAFQSLVLNDIKRTSGMSYRAHTFNVHIGRPLTDGVYSYVSAVAPGARIGNRDDGKPAWLTLTLRNASAEYGIHDGYGMLFIGAPAQLDANVNLKATLATDDGKAREVNVVGHSEKSVIAAAMTPGDVSDVIQRAAEDAVKQVGDIVSGQLHEMKLARE